MFNSNSTNKSKPSLDGMVFCANCGSEMDNTGERYYCRNTTVEAGGNCATSPVNAAQLVRAVITQVVNRLATDETVESITKSIMDTTENNARTQRSRMEQAEAKIAEITARRPAVLQPVEHDIKPYSDVSDVVTELEQSTAGLSFESMVAREELDKIDFIRDEDGIREAARNPKTYLGGNSLDETQELLNLLVHMVRVDTGSAEIIYQVPMPSAGQPQGINHDLVILN